MTTTKTKIKHVAFYMYPVGQMERSRAFYENVLGFTVSNNFDERWVEYDIAGQTLAITTEAEGTKPGAPGGGISFEVDDIDALFAEFKQQNVPIILEIMETPVCRLGVIGDPDGNGIMMHQSKMPH